MWVLVCRKIAVVVTRTRNRSGRTNIGLFVDPGYFSCVYYLLLSNKKRMSCLLEKSYLCEKQQKMHLEDVENHVHVLYFIL